MSVLRQYHAEELVTHGELFRILETTDHLQVAVMEIAVGETSGEYGTDHPDADQLVVVLDGSGTVRCDGRAIELTKGDVVLIPAGADHQVIGPNRTLNVYAPVAYPDNA